MPDKPKLVPLLEALQKVQRRHSVDAPAARGIIIKANRLGDLKFMISRPDGTLEPLDLRRYELRDDDECFDTGIIEDVPYSVPGRLGLPGAEPCRVFVTQESLDAFPGIAKSKAKSPGPVPGTLKRFYTSDRALFPEMKRLVGEGRSPTAAARKLAEERRVDGTGTSTPESRATRLANLYRREHK